MNLLEIVQRVWTETGRTGSGPATVTGAAGDARLIVARVGDAYKEIQRMPRGWRWLRGTNAVQLPAQASHATTAFSGTRFGSFVPESDDYKPSAFLASDPANEWGLSFLKWEVFRSMFVVGQHDAAAPQYWSVGPGDLLYVGPTPDQIYTYRFDFWKSPQSLTADADTPEMPERFHMAIVWKAVMLMSAGDSDSSAYLMASGQYEELESDLILDQGSRITTSWIPMA